MRNDLSLAHTVLREHCAVKKAAAEALAMFVAALERYEEMSEEHDRYFVAMQDALERDCTDDSKELKRVRALLDGALNPSTDRF